MQVLDGRVLATGKHCARKATERGPRPQPRHVSRIDPESYMTEVKLRKGEPVEKAIRRLKKKLDRENVIKDVRAKRYYEKPCERRRRKAKVAAFNAMLRARYES